MQERAKYKFVYGEKLSCRKCGIEYPFTEKYFKKDKRKLSGLTNLCKDCYNIYNKKRYRNKNPQERRLYIYGDRVYCSVCKEEYIFNEIFFGKDKSRKYGLESVCKKFLQIQNKKGSFRRKEYFKTLKGKYAAYKHGAKIRNLFFDLTLEGFEQFWKKPCQYCGIEIETIGLDRMDNTKGYTLENVVPCCYVCNKMKLDGSYEDFIYKCYSIVIKNYNSILKKGNKNEI